MKIILIALSLCSLIVSSCEQHEPDNHIKKEQYLQEVKYTEIRKVVAGKKESTQTEYKNEYSMWEGKVKLVPDVHSVYYLIYSDGSHDKVSIDKYVLTNVGDTVVVARY